MKGARSERLKQRRHMHEYNVKNKEKKQSAREDKTEKLDGVEGCCSMQKRPLRMDNKIRDITNQK